MAKKVRDIVAKVGEYTDRNTGDTKARWKNVGALMKNDEDNSYFIMLERTFNPAGMPNPDNRESVLLSCFVPQEQRQDRESGAQAGNSAGAGHEAGQTASGAGGGSGGLPNDEIPFLYEWR